MFPVPLIAAPVRPYLNTPTVSKIKIYIPFTIVESMVVIFNRVTNCDFSAVINWLVYDKKLG